MPKWNLPVDPEELNFALQLGNAAGIHRMPMDNPESKGIDLLDEDSGEIQQIRFTDNPINRFGGAIAQEFGEDESKFYSIMTRLMALMRLLSDDERVKPFTKDHPDDSEQTTLINNVLIEVMAKISISRDGEFDKEEFFKKAHELEKEDNDNKQD